jgi:hypothetical protein
VFLLFVLFLTAATSLFAYAATKGRRTLSAGFLRKAGRWFFEYIGAFACFLALNMVLGVIIIVMFRGITSHFVPVYDVRDPLIFILSAAQGFIFQKWWSRDET